ncbi:MAG: dimethylsulfoniopropionate demethylase [Cognatishimia sp.]|uniref:dimethylsulfoniopropionate demethylase n=1 Tax=Cognatishimia sp. TaxID=2211648 RepID=UPI003B8E4D72
MSLLSKSRRLRETPFTPGVKRNGVKAYTVYNRMLLPTVFESVEADYHHLKNHVQVWDVSCERQVELWGPDASKLMKRLTPRNLDKMQDDQCYYVPVVDENGGMLNDPVAIKHSDDRWWISIADSDLLFWVKGLAIGAGLNVRVIEPDVYPLAVQGPKADDLMARVFGDEVRSIGFFRYKWMRFKDTKFIVARSGYSKQGGYEIYVENEIYAMPLWDALFDAGADLNVRAGCPNLIERVEGGLLSYGNDMTMANTPLECDLGRFCKPAENNDFIGREILEQEIANGPSREVRPITISGDAVTPPTAPWPLFKEGKQVGSVTSAAWSPDFQENIAIGMVETGSWDAGTILDIDTSNGPRQAEVKAEFWSK